MISSPQGDLKHTGHVGLDDAYFGDKVRINGIFKQNLLIENLIEFSESINSCRSRSRRPTSRRATLKDR